VDEFFHIRHMQANRGLVQHITNALQVAAKLRRQANALRLATTERGRATVQRKVAKTHLFRTRAVAGANAADGQDLIVLATGYADAAGALGAVGNLTGKVVIDITNPLTADYMGLTVGHSTSAAEEIARAVPGAHVVKAFNTLFAQVLSQGAKLGDQALTVFYAGDDEAAKASVKALAESLGYATVDAGALKNARYLEPLAGLNIYFGYGAGRGTAIAPAWHGFV
jgi:predicted dinucleotide-binding enzyme